MFTIFDNEEEAFVCNDRTLRENWGDPRFPSACYKFAMQATEALINGDIDTFEELYRFLADKRKTYSPDMEITFRTTSLHTPIAAINCYRDQYPILKKMFISSLSQAQSKEEIVLNSQYRSNLVITFRYKGQDTTKLIYYSLCYDDTAPIMIFHAPPCRYKEFLPEIEDIFKALKEKASSGIANEEHTFYLLGKLHWLLAHACPLTRGSAATTEMATRAIYKMVFPDRKLVPYKEGITPDLAALFSPDIEEFATGYKHIFISPAEQLQEPLVKPSLGL